MLSNDLLNDVIHLWFCCCSSIFSPSPTLTDECLRRDSTISYFSRSKFKHTRSCLLFRCWWPWQKGFASSTRRMSFRSTRQWQRGDIECVSSHVSTHSTWNMCLIFGNSRRTSTTSNLFRHTTQSSLFLLPP